ncbi:hypothetical protein T265_14830, partial [Opisthorchis viverrini]
MPPEGCTRAGILPGCPSLDNGSREAEVGLEPRTFRSVNSRFNHLGHLVPHALTTGTEIINTGGLENQDVAQQKNREKTYHFNQLSTTKLNQQLRTSLKYLWVQVIQSCGGSAVLTSSAKTTGRERHSKDNSLGAGQPLAVKVTDHWFVVSQTPSGETAVTNATQLINKDYHTWLHTHGLTSAESSTSDTRVGKQLVIKERTEMFAVRTRLLSRHGQPGSVPVVVLPSGGMAARHRKGATAERLFLFIHLVQRILRGKRSSAIRKGLPNLRSELCSISLSETFRENLCQTTVIWSNECTPESMIIDTLSVPSCHATHEGGTEAGILPGCPSLDRGSRVSEVGFEPRTFRSVNSRPNHLVRLAPLKYQD